MRISSRCRENPVKSVSKSKVVKKKTRTKKLGKPEASVIKTKHNEPDKDGANHTKRKRGPSDQELQKASNGLFSLKEGIRDRQKVLAKTDVRHLAGELRLLNLK